jgi:EAL domain-containing protein (putative c-di-GMP-specific phosphodiesterase class I)
MIEDQEKLQYLFRSLKHHPSPYLIYELDGSIRWANLAAKYILRIEDLNDLTVLIPRESLESLESKDGIAQAYDSPIEVSLRQIKFLMRTRVHRIPFEGSEDFLLIEILCSSRDGLEALQMTISCIEFDRIDLAYQKQIDLKSNKVTGVEALLRMRDETGEIIPNDVLIPQIEGESLFSLVVMSSLEKLKEYFKKKDEIGLSDATVYLNVSAHTVMHPEFCNIFTNFVESLNLKPNEFGLEVTETAELGDTKTASDSLKKLKEKGIKIALDDFGAGYSSLRYLKDLPVDVVKLDKMFTGNIQDPVTGKLTSFVVEVCNTLSMEMIGEGIETEEQKQAMIEIGCQIGQGFLMHKPEFLTSLKN